MRKATGVLVDGAPTNTIGGTTGTTPGGACTGACNVIAGNNTPSGGGYGVRIQGAGATGNRVEGNYIGIDATGTGSVNNVGVAIDGAANNTVGGTTAATRNVISGNGTGVVVRGAGATGNQVQGN